MGCKVDRFEDTKDQKSGLRPIISRLHNPCPKAMTGRSKRYHGHKTFDSVDVESPRITKFDGPHDLDADSRRAFGSLGSLRGAYIAIL